MQAKIKNFVRHIRGEEGQHFLGDFEVVGRVGQHDVDVETGGFNADTDALLEVAACIIRMDDFGRLFVAETIDVNVEPFDGANLDPKSLEIT